MRVLIIEDERKTVAFLSKGLSEAGYIVDTEANGEEGLFLVLSKHYDLMSLPSLDGKFRWHWMKQARKCWSAGMNAI
jgi:two-component system copper resistance phosphate regulon response regulator CusR